MIEQFDYPGLAWPVHHRAGGDLPESARRVGGVTARANRVGVRMTVQPQNDIGESVQQGQQVGRAHQRLTARSGVRATGVVQRVGPVMGRQDHQPVLVRSPYVAAI